jgi:putative PIG3 family NAD(P)H quinone oxidoreductase
MRAVFAREPGGPDVLEIREVPDPDPKPGEVVIDVVASAVNRPDIVQRQGHYPPVPGASDVLGLECSGRIAAIGAGVERWQIGDEVCALLASGGYADRVAVPAGQVVAVPRGLDVAHAAALPEVSATVWSNVFMIAALQRGEAFLVHGGGGGIGTMAIQLAAALDARVACTVGSADKAAVCRELGADLAINYREQDFVEEVRRWSESGADVILDIMGAAYLGRNVDALATEGRLVVIGMQGGVKGELDLRRLAAKRGAVISTLLRPRSVAEKAAIMASLEEHVWPLIADGRVRPIIDTTVPLDDVRTAHERVEASQHIGKVLLTTGR